MKIQEKRAELQLYNMIILEKADYKEIYQNDDNGCIKVGEQVILFPVLQIFCYVV